MRRKTLTNNCSDELHSFISLPGIFCEGRCSKVKIMTYTDIMFNSSFSEKKNRISFRMAFKPKGMQEEHEKKPISKSLAQHGNNKFSYCWTSVVTNIGQTLGHLDVSVSGWEVVYSKPSTHQEIVPVNRPWEVAVGVHPKHRWIFQR